MELPEKIRNELVEAHHKGLAQGSLLSTAQLAQYYRAFRAKFGPDTLAQLDGETLLSTMHDHGNHDSLVYWLEFKDDAEFPARFGSIAGGSALKFGLYRRKETGLWMIGSPKDQRELSTDEAVTMARTHRDQLIAGVQVLAAMPSNGSDADYAALQKQMEQVAPDVSRMAWGHKYFSLLYPDKLDDYHAEGHQRFHLIKLLQIPPAGAGRYLTTGRYVALGAALEMPLNHFTTLLNERDGNPHRYWRVLVNHPDLEGREHNWDALHAGDYVAIGWANLGDLSHIGYDAAGKAALLALMQERYKDQGRWGSEIFSFVGRMAECDLVIAFERDKVLGIGRVPSGYCYDPTTPASPHHRQVEWLWQGEAQLPLPEAMGSAVRELLKPENLVFLERLVLEGTPIPNGDNGKVHNGTGKPPRFTGMMGRIQAVLERKKQVILYRPPGTGKTYWARLAAHNLAAAAAYGRAFDELEEQQQRAIVEGTDAHGPLVRVCTFHPAYGYEDFIEGYRPVQLDGQLAFENREGIFKALCREAAAHPTLPFYLIIDEINRGDVPRIFGELLTVLEQDKRSQPVLLPLSGQPFTVPGNVYVIGTMNTADRSIALLDTALRRRFGFIELMPDPSLLADGVIEGSIPLGPWLEALNHNILAHIGRDARNLQIGHAYLLNGGRPVGDFARFARIVQDDILPLLEEYCYEDYVALARILGSRLVDSENQRIRHELFDPARHDALIEALLAPFPDLKTTAAAIAAMPESDAGAEGIGEDEPEESAAAGQDGEP